MSESNKTTPYNRKSEFELTDDEKEQAVASHSTTPSWEAEFDRKFKTPGRKLYQRETMANEIKAFIQSLLDRQQAEAVALGESFKLIEAEFPGSRYTLAWKQGHNHAITTYQKALEALNN